MGDELLENRILPWIIIPCLNPDGISKNTRQNGRGVDLNRNYPSKNWSPDFEKERYHPGAFPGSEPEISGLVQLIDNSHPRLIIHCHSWKPMIVLTGSPGREAAEKLSKSSGYGIEDHIGYPTPGSLSHYGWEDLRIPIICIEEEEEIDADKSWDHFREGFEKILTAP